MLFVRLFHTEPINYENEINKFFKENGMMPELSMNKGGGK